ncbi:heparinase II/III domain-containing protein [Alloprevotella rava]|uniref:Heparinase II/III-like C-terminal domain-containing protein n=1 Tax=Alloprevotella rava TaxID=671218 RepID=A0A7W5UJ01_9BACT|nr:heparinase II/III family protein [Alloprevotella rava]MBB3702322.1 hypothetical protein [Alloprevotella rava]
MLVRKLILFLCLFVVSFAEAVAQSAFAPFPKASDAYWRNQVPKAMRQDYIRLGKKYQLATWESIPDSAFAEFRKNGNRTNYEASCFLRRRQFACLVMAEIMEYRGRFMPEICKGLHYFLDKEPWWGVPAHYPKAHPDSSKQVVDLFNAETSSMLAWSLYMLGEEIDNVEKGLTERTYSEIRRRFLRPTVTEKQSWMRKVNNWNSWITSNFLATSLICEPSGSNELHRALDVSEACLRLFLKGYPDDGGCEEGAGYWDRASASFFESLWMLRAAASTMLPTDHRYVLTPAEEEKVAAMGRFISTMHIGNLSFVNFSDAKVHNVPNINIMFPYGAWLNSSHSTQPALQKVGLQLMQFAAYVANQYDYYRKPSTLFLKTGCWPTLGRELMLLSMLPQLRKSKALQPQTKEAYLQNLQIMVAGNRNWLVAAKGGTNGESHNHNDVGSFVVYRKAKPVIIDLGRDIYTAQTFSSRRYELINNRSMYHNVPLINGVEQHSGLQYHATDVQHTVSDSASIFTLDIANAYPKEAGVSKWQRTVMLNKKRNRVEVSEHYQAHDVIITLMCYGCPAMQKNGQLLLADGVKLVYDADKTTVAWQKVVMPEGMMKKQWDDNVYRIELKPKTEVSDIEYRFECTP